MKPCFDILGSIQAVRVKARGFAIVMGIFPKFVNLTFSHFPWIYRISLCVQFFSPHLET